MKHKRFSEEGSVEAMLRAVIGTVWAWVSATKQRNKTS